MDLSKKRLKKVAICGKANSGKSSTAKLIAAAICEETAEYKVIAFADPMKRAVMTMYPWADPKCLYGPSKLRNTPIPNTFDKNGNPLTYRQLLIDIGTAARDNDLDHWVKVFDHNIAQLDECSTRNPGPTITRYVKRKLLIVPDLRFRNEFDYLRQKGFFIIKLLRTTDVVIDSPTETNQDSIAPTEFDYVLDNNGTLDDLKTEVKQIVKLIKKRK
jgi:Deoxynucleotide monophosphate kinase